jgi:hypothetical protein
MWWSSQKEEDRSVNPTEESVSFNKDIKPLFRELDRESMKSHFDLWSYDDVRRHADSILSRVSAGTMPCDGRWSDAQVAIFRSWAESDKAE